MTVKPAPIPSIPEQTKRVAEASFPNGNVYIQMRDELGSIYTDELFIELYSDEGQPGWSPWRLALVTIMQFAENLSDRQAAEAVRASLAANPLLKTDLSYFPWDQQGGRLQTLRTGIPSDSTSLQSLEYDYDLAGNFDWIKDYKAGGTQTQFFGYDTLDRLNSAQASGGTGGLYGPFTYAFSATTGNLIGKEGTTLSYNASVSCPAGTRSIPHAASSFGSTTYSYDCNGNQVSKTA